MIDRVAVVDSGVEVPIGVPVNVTPFVSCVLFGVEAFSSAVSVYVVDPDEPAAQPLGSEPAVG